MNHQEKEVVQAALRKYRSQRARSFIRPKSKEEQKAIMDKARSFITPEAREKARRSLIGSKRTPEQKENIRKAALGRKLSEETKEKIRQSLLGRKNPSAKNEHSFKSGSEHPNWKGPKVGYRDLHLWVERRLGKPDTCEHCHVSGFTGHYIHWANKSGNYKRDTNDWIRLCAKCHKKYDKITH